MATDTRATRLRQRVQDFIGDHNGLGIGLATAVYRALDRVQYRICEEANAYETYGSINLVADTELYNFPDGMIGEMAVVGGTHGPIVGSVYSRIGLVDRINEVTVNQAETTITFDQPFVKTYTNLSGNSVPAYRFTVESAAVGTSETEESITIVSKSLSGMVLKSTSNGTLVKFLAAE
jgi:hypothetical protein